MQALRSCALSTILAATSLLLLAACGGGGGGGSSTPRPPPSTPPAPQLPDASTAPALKTVFAPYFRIGAAVVLEQIDAATHPDDVALLRKHFSSITVANAMKADTVAVAEGQYNFEPADQIVAFAQDNGIEVRAHTLVWHVTSPDWFFAGDRSDPVAYRALVRHRLQTYITDVVTHFKGKVYAWDVVNEVAGTAQGQTYRTDSPWYEAYSVGGGNGADYIEDAFRAARAPDPDVKLFINDFLTENPVKRANVLAIVQDLLDKGVPIDGVGHQIHSQINLSAAGVDAALTAVEELSPSLINEVTELDLSVYTGPSVPSNYGAGGIPNAVAGQQARTYRELFDVLRRHDASLDSVTTWGISDAETWLDYSGTTFERKDYPLLFDVERQPKWSFWAIVDPAVQLP
jgi:endo-1,4-beta-xylanase